MEQEFDILLMSLLESYEENPEQNIDVLIAEKCKEWKLSEEQIALLNEANACIDSFTEKATSLEKVKLEGKSRKRWMMDEIDCITEGRSEKEKVQIISTISDTNEKIIEEITAKE